MLKESLISLSYTQKNENEDVIGVVVQVFSKKLGKCFGSLVFFSVVLRSCETDFSGNILPIIGDSFPKK